MIKRFETFTVLVNRISRNIRKIKNREMAEYDLRSSHISCLFYLYTEKGLTATELCERCEEDKATISRALVFLETNGFIKSAAKDTKRYKAPISLTEKGNEAGKKISDKIGRLLEEVGRELSEEERAAFYRCLSIISEGLERVAEK